MKELGNELARLSAEAESRLRSISEGDANRMWAEGKTWSRKQVLGHLIDSAANNHQRFVRMQTLTTLDLPGYEADEWVARGHYDQQSWSDVITLWSAYNLHLAHVISGLDTSIGDRVWINGRQTLDMIARGYVRHIRHHLAQIYGESDGAPFQNEEI